MFQMLHNAVIISLHRNKLSNDLISTN